MKKLAITFPDKLGGVTSFNRALTKHINLPDDWDYHVFFLRNKDDDAPQANKDEFDQKKQSTIIFSQYDKLQLRLEKFGEELKQFQAILTDNSFTLETIGFCNIQSAVFLMIHDFYYVKLALAQSGNFDFCISHANLFRDFLIIQNPQYFAKQSYYIPYGVECQDDNHMQYEKPDELHICFLGRIVGAKGIHQLLPIHREMEAFGLEPKWTIIGDGEELGQLQSSWRDIDNVDFSTPKTADGVRQLLKNQHFLIFPSYFEGTPVAILESMEQGVIPICHNLPGGIRESISDDTGVLCEIDTPREFAIAVHKLWVDRKELISVSDRCRKFIRKERNAKQCFEDYGRVISTNSFEVPTRARKPPVENRLDNPFIPNSVVSFLRKRRK